MRRMEGTFQLIGVLVLAELLVSQAGAGAVPPWEDVVWVYQGNLATARFDGSSFGLLVDESDDIYSVKVSPDLSRLAYVVEPGTGPWRICVLDLSGTSCAVIPVIGYDLAWDADSRKVYFDMNEGDGQIWVIDFGNLSPVATLFYDPPVYRSMGMSISGDGSKMVVAHDPHNWTYDNYLSVYDFASRTASTIYPSNGLWDFWPEYSKTRDEIVWVQMDGGGNPDIWRLNGDGSNVVNLTTTPGGDETYPAYSPDGEHVFYSRDGMLWVMTREGADPTVLFTLDSSGRDRRFAVTRDLGPRPDTEPPVSQIHLDGPMGRAPWYVGPVGVSFAADDGPEGSGIAQIEMSLDHGATWSVSSGSLTLSAQGETSIWSRATDNAGNVEAPPAETNLWIDSQAPSSQVVIVGSPGLDGWWLGPVSAEILASDPQPGSGVGEIQYTISQGAPSVYGGPIAIVSSGHNPLSSSARDRAGNLEAVHGVAIDIDAEAPSAVTAASPASLWPPNHRMVDVVVQVQATDDASGIARIEVVSATSNQSTNSHEPDVLQVDDYHWKLRAERDGAGPRVYTLSYRVVDGAGRSSVAACTVVVAHDQGGQP